MRLLVLNCGSSSIKYQVFDAESMDVLAKGLVDRIASGDSEVVLEADGLKDVRRRSIPDHEEALRVILDRLASQTGSAGSDDGYGAVGHRVVHGGESFREAVKVTPDVIARIERCVPLAPLHNPPALAGIRSALQVLPGVPQVAVFDTAFHADMPAVAHTYALPYEYYVKHGVRRYGFHGLSFDYVLQRVRNTEAGRSWTRIIVAHLGNGASMAAIHGDRSIDTSMGMTPLEGLVMGSRCGDVDPGVVVYLQKNLGLSVDDMEQVLNRESGLLGLSGVGSDMRDVQRSADEGDHRSRLAIDVFAYRVKKYVGALTAALGGLDALVFSGGIGENCPQIRLAACRGLEHLGIHLDVRANDADCSGDREISSRESAVRVLVVPTDEERLIAEKTIALVNPALGETAM
jgi:acetate kinase